MTFGKRLRELRQAKKMNQRDLSKLVGIDFTYLSKLENDRMPAPAAATITRLSDELDGKADELMLLAKKVPADLTPVITRSPVLPAFLRSIKDFDDSQVQELGEYAQKMRERKD